MALLRLMKETGNVDITAETQPGQPAAIQPATAPR
jgi:hypothetical protein